ncbi:MAG: amino-acid N-acetyltransferase [Pseudomonadales bacterium]|nr:amino-acid N-acetyltransferase [Pseudomonadales bacterium]MBO6703152.1 amino-acid N-acetyltransferase [Pseudomonadales bacterium]
MTTTTVMALNNEHIKWFRDSSPYIDAHRDRTFVICLTGDALRSANLKNIVSDCALLNSLGVRLILVFNGDSAILEALGDEWSLSGQHRITTPEQIETVTAVVGGKTHELAAMFAASSPDTPTALNKTRREVLTSSGSFVKARPIGIVDGIDFQNSGNVRKVQGDAIAAQLNNGAVVLVPPVGYSPSGEIFYLDAIQIACETACELNAEKLIFLTQHEGLLNEAGETINEVDLSHPEPALSTGTELLPFCHVACQQGVGRCHILSYDVDGALLEELFTRDGCGTQVVGHSYEQIRDATTDDVAGILRLISPLEDAGILVKRSRERLESEIDRFLVIERDGLLISCGALYPYHCSEKGGFGELACLVTHPDYRKSDRGDRLLESVEKRAREDGLSNLFVLTTQSAHWFQERGFVARDRDTLPQARQALYNDQRGSTVLVKPL